MQTAFRHDLRRPETRLPDDGKRQEDGVDRVTARVVTRDAISSAGIDAILRRHPRIALMATDRPADVMIFASTQITSQDIQWLREMRGSSRSIVLLTNSVSESPLLTLIQCGVVAIVDRGCTTSEELVDAVLAAAENHGVMSQELLGKLLSLVRAMQHKTPGPLGFNSAGLTDREVEILRLLAEGADTSEIARRLTYSESTIKHVLHTMTTRFHFRNRVHAVATAVRAGVL